MSGAKIIEGIIEQSTETDELFDQEMKNRFRAERMWI